MVPFDPQELQAVITSFAEAWQLEPQRAEDWLARHPEFASHADAALEIIYTEFVLRQRSGEEPTLEEYVARFPQYRAPLAEQLELHQLLSTSWLDSFAGPTEISQTKLSAAEPREERQPTSTRFEIVRRLGSGGMGVVYAAHDALWGQTVALKTVRDERAYVQHLKKEFRTLADVSHPNIVSLYELFSEPGQTFFTMELVEGVNFVAAVRSAHSRSPDWQRLEQLLLQAARGIAFLHQQKILHCDIKPSNFLVTPADRCVLLDFGLATELVAHSPGAESVGGGTIAYFAPEVRRGEPHSKASDWYALGVTLYQAMFGCNPESLGGTVFPKPEVESAISNRLRDWCAGLLETEAQRRLETAEALCQAAHADKAIRPAEVFGREDLLRQLEELRQGVQNGQPTMLLLEGESGVGKTTVLKTGLAKMPAGTWKLLGRCHPCESVPFKAIDQIIEQLTQYLLDLPDDELRKYLSTESALLTRMFPCLGRAFQKLGTDINTEPLSRESGVGNRQLEQVLRNLLAQLARDRVLVLAIDDLQWGDDDSVQLLKQLFFGPDPPCVLLLGSYRPAEVIQGSLLEELISASNSGYRPVVRIRREVPPLSVPAMEQLLAASLPRLEAHTQQELIKSSRGNPFLLQQLCHAYQQNGHNARFAEAEDLIWKRIEELDPHSCELLSLLSLVGKAARQATIFAAFSPSEAWQASLHLVRKAGLLRVSGTHENDSLEISHDRVRETMLAKLSDTQRQTHHHRLALAFLQQEPKEVDALAYHYEGASQWTEAARYSEQAANLAAQQLAFRKAAELYRKVLHWRRDKSPEALRALREKLGFAEAHAGRGRQAAEQFLLLAKQFPENSLDYRRRAMHQLVTGGNFVEALVEAKQIASAVGVSIPQSEFVANLKLIAESVRQACFPLKAHQKTDQELAPQTVLKIECLQSLSLSFMPYRPARGALLCLQFQRAAFQAGTQRHLAHAFAQRAGLNAISSNYDQQSEEDLKQAYVLAEKNQGEGTFASVYSWHSLINLVQGRWRDSVDLYHKLLQLTPADDQDFWFWWTGARAYLWMPCFFAGRVGDIRRLLWIWLQDAKDRGDALGRVVLPLDYGAIHWLAADDPDTAEAVLAETVSHFPSTSEELLLTRALIFRVLVSLYRGDAANAWQHMVQAHPHGMPFGVKHNALMRPLCLQFRGTAALAAYFQHGHKLLPTVAACRQKLLREKYRWNHAFATLLQAGSLLAQGQLEQAFAQYVRAKEQFTEVNMPLYAAVCQRRHGELLGGETGQQLVASANQTLLDAEIENPDSIARMIAPVPENLRG